MIKFLFKIELNVTQKKKEKLNKKTREKEQEKKAQVRGDWCNQSKPILAKLIKWDSCQWIMQWIMSMASTAAGFITRNSGWIEFQLKIRTGERKTFDMDALEQICMCPGGCDCGCVFGSVGVW